MIKSKKQMYIVIGVFALILTLFTTTYAFFNYTRTGSSNVIKTGRISFSTSQDGNLSLTNVFPVASNSVGNDYTTDTLKIAITGDTTYSEGIEYLVTAEDVNVETSTGKKVPMTLKVAVTDDLGTQDTDNDEIEYFTDRGGNTSYYKILSESVLYEGQYLLVGYIAPGQTGIDGTVNIKAYLDEDRVAISDTYPEGEVSHTEGVEPNQETIIDGYNGTTSNWVDGRVVLTTSEWNSLQTVGNELSFKVRVEANEGTWVDPATPINAVGRIPVNLKQNITEIYFIKETPIRLQQRYDAAEIKADMTDTTLNEGRVLGWQEENKLYIASTGETFFPENSGTYFGNLSDVTKIEFENVNMSRVINANTMFVNCSSLISIDLSNLNANNITNMNAMFVYCGNLVNVNLSNMGNASLSNILSIFQGCNSLKTINMSGFNFGTASLDRLFYQLTNLESVDLSNVNTSNVTDFRMMFYNCAKLISLDLSDFDTQNVENMYQTFAYMTNLKDLNLDNWNLSSLTNFSGTFDRCSSIVNLDLSNINVGNVTTMYAAFRYMTSLKALNVSGWGSNNLTDMADIFYGTGNLEEINMSNFNFGTASMGYTSSFRYLNKLKKIDLHNSNTSRVPGMYDLFSGCSNLEEVDMRGLDFGSVTIVDNFFYNCSNLKTIYASSDWNIPSSASSNNMFYGCTSLVGGAGTTFDSNNPIDKTYSHIDGGPSNPGYLTLKTN